MDTHALVMSDRPQKQASAKADLSTFGSGVQVLLCLPAVCCTLKVYTFAYCLLTQYNHWQVTTKQLARPRWQVVFIVWGGLFHGTCRADKTLFYGTTEKWASIPSQSSGITTYAVPWHPTVTRWPGLPKVVLFPDCFFPFFICGDGKKVWWISVGTIPKICRSSRTKVPTEIHQTLFCHHK